MTAPRNLPNRQRMQRIKGHEHGREAAGFQKLDQRKDRERFEGQHRRLHHRDGLAYTAHQEKNCLRHGRVDSGRILLAVHALIDSVVAEMGERGVGRDIAIRIDAIRLNAAIPDVAIDVGRVRRRKQKERPHEDSEPEQVKKVTPVLPFGEPAFIAPEQPGEDRVKPALREREIDDRVVFLSEKRKCASHHGKGERSGCDCKRLRRRPSDHAAASRNGFEAASARKRSRRSPKFAAWNMVSRSAVEFGAELDCRLAENLLPARSSSASSLNAAASSISYHSGRIWTGRPISAARSKVCAKTASVLQGTPLNRCGLSVLLAKR